MSDEKKYTEPHKSERLQEILEELTEPFVSADALEDLDPGKLDLEPGEFEHVRWETIGRELGNVDRLRILAALLRECGDQFFEIGVGLGAKELGREVTMSLHNRARVLEARAQELVDARTPPRQSI